VGITFFHLSIDEQWKKLLFGTQEVNLGVEQKINVFVCYDMEKSWLGQDNQGWVPARPP
jgi:hypothetical protein